jgi:hypothetical protein
MLLNSAKESANMESPALRTLLLAIVIELFALVVRFVSPTDIVAPLPVLAISSATLTFLIGLSGLVLAGYAWYQARPQPFAAPQQESE